MKEITKAQEQILKVLWQLESAMVKEVIAELPEPKPSYTTVSTVIRVLEAKGYVGHQAFGKTHVYHPLVSKEAYASYYLKGSMETFFNNSIENVVSFFASNKKMSLEELEGLKKYVEAQIEKNK